MATHGKKYVEARGQIDREATYSPVEAIRKLKGQSLAKFDETVEVHFSPRRKCTSTVSSNLARLWPLSLRIASTGEYVASRSIWPRASTYFFPCVAITRPPRLPSSGRCPR